MLIVLYLLTVVVVLFVAAVAATRDGDVLAPAPPDQADLGLPDGPMQPEDVAEVRFGLTLRGYRMREVDDVLARLAGELGARDRRIALLEQALAPEPEEGHGGWADPSGLPEGVPSSAVTLTKDQAEELPAEELPEEELPEEELPEEELPEEELPAETAALAHDERAVHVPVAEPPAPLSSRTDDDFPEVSLPEAAAPELPEATEQDDRGDVEEPPAPAALEALEPLIASPSPDPFPHVPDFSAEQPASDAEGWFDAPWEEEPAPESAEEMVEGPPPALGPPGEGAATQDSDDSGGGRPTGV